MYLQQIHRSIFFLWDVWFECQIVCYTVEHLWIINEIIVHCSDAGTGGAKEATGPSDPLPPYLTDQLTLFQPGRADYPHLLLLAPPMFFTFRHHCQC